MTLTTNTGDDMLDELGLLLARYADSALRPDPAAMDRIRENLRAQAQRASVHRRAEALAIAAVPAAPIVPARRPFARSTPRRLSLALAASLVLGLAVGTSAFGASRAGGPLYDVRVSLESLTLPADPEARLAAELERLQWRLAEANEAAARGDTNAVMAALAAYQRIMDETATIDADDGAVEAAIDQIAHHQTILDKLLQQVPEQAQDAVRKAQDKSDNAVKDLKTPPPNRGNDPSQGPKKSPPPKPTPGSNQGGDSGTPSDPPGGRPSEQPGPGGSQGGQGGAPSGDPGSGGQGPPGSDGDPPSQDGSGGQGGSSGQGEPGRTPRPDKTKGP